MVFLPARTATSSRWAAPVRAPIRGALMQTFLKDIEFANPAFLWLLLALPVIWFRLRDRRLPVIIARTLILGLLILTVADPQSTGEQSRTQQRIFAFDLSDSIPNSMRKWMKDAGETLGSPRRTDHVLVFGANA